MNILTNSSHLDNLKWDSKLVNGYKGNLTGISESIPFFERKPFKIDGSENKNLDVVINTSDNGTPIATVSKSYSLVQHFGLTLRYLATGDATVLKEYIVLSKQGKT